MANQFQPLLWAQTNLEPLEAGSNKTAVKKHVMMAAYQKVTLKGIGGDGSVLGQEIHIPLDSLAPDEITIYADELYLQPGAQYRLPGKKLTLIARRLGMSSSAKESCNISVDGEPGPAAMPPTIAAKPPEPPKAPFERNWFTLSTGTRNAENGNDGQMGAKGIDGNPGMAAGCIDIFVHEFDPNIKTILSARGGKGSAGLNGQDGQPGQQGQAGSQSVIISLRTGSKTQPILNGQGGVGGDGGPAGSGGSPGLRGTINCYSVIAPHEGCSIQADVAAGEYGSNGTPGNPGRHGDPGNKPYCEDPQPPADKRTARKGSEAPPLTAKLPDGDYRKGVFESPEEFSNKLRPEHVGMLLERLRFIHLTRLTFPNLLSSAPDTSPKHELSNNEIDDALKLLNWIGESLARIKPADAPQWSEARLLHNVLAHQIANRIDFYGNQFDMVPVLNSDISGLEKMLVGLAKAESWFCEIQNAVRDYEKAKADVQSNYTLLTNDIADRAADVSKLMAFINGEAKTAIESGIAEVTKAKNTLDTLFANELTNVALGLNWSLSGMLGCMGSLLMFAGPEFSLATTAGKAYASGGVLSMMGQFDFDHVETSNGTVDKKYLVSQMKQVEGDIKKLQAAWVGSENGFLQPNGSRSLILAKKSEFDSFLEKYFADDTPLREAVDQYMDAVQRQNEAVVRYNEAVSKLWSCQADSLRSKQARAIDGAGLSALNSPGLMQLAALSQHAYTKQVLEALHQLYLAGRAYSCLALEPCAALNDLSILDGLGELDTNSLRSALTTLNQALKQYQDGLIRVPSEMTLTLEANEHTDRSKIAAIKSGRKVTFFVQPDSNHWKNNDNLAGKFNIRVNAVRAYLKGTSPGSDIQLNIESGGRCRLQANEHAAPIAFETPKVVYKNVFRVDEAGAFCDVSKEKVQWAKMRWANDASADFASPLLGISSAWTISGPDRKLDLSNIRGIELAFDIQFQ